MPLNPRPPLASAGNRESIRASVLDVFLQLGALDDNSRIAEWIFPAQEGEGEAEQARPGLKFRETPREPKDLNVDLEDTPRRSRASRFFAKVRSRSKTRRETESEKSNPKSFFSFLSKSSTDLHARPTGEDVPPPLPTDNALPMYFPKSPISVTTSEPRSSAYEDWEEISAPLASPGIGGNPFLHGRRRTGDHNSQSEVTLAQGSHSHPPSPSTDDHREGRSSFRLSYHTSRSTSQTPSKSRSSLQRPFSIFTTRRTRHMSLPAGERAPSLPPSPHPGAVPS